MCASVHRRQSSALDHVVTGEHAGAGNHMSEHVGAPGAPHERKVLLACEPSLSQLGLCAVTAFLPLLLHVLSCVLVQSF